VEMAGGEAILLFTRTTDGASTIGISHLTSRPRSSSPDWNLLDGEAGQQEYQPFISSEWGGERLSWLGYKRKIDNMCGSAGESCKEIVWNIGTHIKGIQIEQRRTSLGGLSETYVWSFAVGISFM